MALRLVLTCLVGLTLVARADAITILDQPLDPTVAGVFSNLTTAQRADNFVLTQATTLESISWAGRYNGPQMLADPVSFSIRFFEDDGGTPGVPVTVFFEELAVDVAAVPTGDSFDGSPWFSYSFAPLGLALDPGVYWVSILESDPRTLPEGESQWLWGVSERGAEASASRGADSDPWNIAGNNLAFTLTGTPTPEPSPLGLAVMGLIGAALAWRRKR